MRRRIVVGRFKLKKVIYEVALDTWVKPLAKFSKPAISFIRREEARAEKRR